MTAPVLEPWQERREIFNEILEAFTERCIHLEVYTVAVRNTAAARETVHTPLHTQCARLASALHGPKNAHTRKAASRRYDALSSWQVVREFLQLETKPAFLHPSDRSAGSCFSLSHMLLLPSHVALAI